MSKLTKCLYVLKGFLTCTTAIGLIFAGMVFEQRANARQMNSRLSRDRHRSIYKRDYKAQK